MKEKPGSDKTGTWIVRQIPSDLMVRTRMAALVEGKTVRKLLMELVEARLAELERKGMLAKGR